MGLPFVGRVVRRGTLGLLVIHRGQELVATRIEYRDSSCEVVGAGVVAIERHLNHLAISRQVERKINQSGLTRIPRSRPGND